MFCIRCSSKSAGTQITESYFLNLQHQWCLKKEKIMSALPWVNPAARASQRKSQPLKWAENLAATNPETNKVFQFRRKVSADNFNIQLQRGLERGLISFSCLPILSYSLHICRWSFNRKVFFFLSEIGPFLNTDQH